MKRFAVLSFLLLFTLPLVAQTPAAPAAGGPLGYTAAYVIEPTTGRVLYEYNAHTPLPTASMAKMMTLLIAMERIRDGELKLNEPVTISANASKMGGSQIYAKHGQVFPVQTLLAAIMIQSANDASMAMAEKIAGSGELFADMMNQRAQQLGLKNSRFFDPHGLPPADKSRNNVMSAHDLAVLGQEVMKYPLLAQYAKMPTMPFSNGTFTAGMTNPNHLLRWYQGATGIKTGYSGPAGFSVTASATRGNMSLVCVVMGAKTSRGPQSSFELAAKLMNEAFAQYKMVDVIKKGARVGAAPVKEGQAASVPLVASRDVRTLVKRSDLNGAAKPKVVPTTLTAPVKAGQQGGMIIVQQGNQVIAKVPALTAGAVEKQPWWKAFLPW
jgi:serine-type D-Ala-D-Ala carboxypeptidase (penicillin-binding protein 5/6)